MTKEKLEKIPFRMVSHLSMEDEHCITYKAVHPFLDLGMCIHQPYKDGVPKGKSYTHYMWNGKVYKSLEKLLDAMNQI